MTANMKLLGWKRRIADSSLRGRLATNQNGQAAKEKKQNVVAGAGCSENSSGFRLREKCFSLDIPFYRTSGLPVIHPTTSLIASELKPARLVERRNLFTVIVATAEIQGCHATRLDQDHF